MGEAARSFMFVRLLVVLTEKLLDKLNFQHGTVAIVDVSETICGANRQLFVNIEVEGVVCHGNVQELFEILRIHLIVCVGIRHADSRLVFQLCNNFSEDSIECLA